MISASGLVALLGAIASFGNALPITATAGSPTDAGSCTKTSCLFSYNFTHRQDYCVEADAAARMPDNIWDNQAAVDAYVAATIKYYEPNGILGEKLQLIGCKQVGRSLNKNYIQYANSTVPWTSPELMETCLANCKCKYPHCPDVPATPTPPGFCSLCGPKFNQPMTVTFWKTGKGPEGL